MYIYWGEDDFSLAQAVKKLRDRFIDPIWASFNYDKISQDDPDAIIEALDRAMTPPFGAGSRFVWLANTTLLQHCSENILVQLERTLPAIPESSVLLLTSASKPDGRLKSTKLLQKFAQEYTEFSPIPPWKTELIVQHIQSSAREMGMKLTPDAIDLLAESVGNDTRLMFSELQKLQLYALGNKPLNAEIVSNLVTANTQNSLQLAACILRGETGKALELIADLINRNEPALRIVATLVGQFRTWLWVKLMSESGEKDETKIAKAADIANPKRIYFILKEIKFISAARLQKTLPILLELEASLKQGGEEMLTLQSKIIELCEVCR